MIDTNAENPTNGGSETTYTQDLATDRVAKDTNKQMKDGTSTSQSNLSRGQALHAVGEEEEPDEWDFDDGFDDDSNLGAGNEEHATNGDGAEIQARIQAEEEARRRKVGEESQRLQAEKDKLLTEKKKEEETLRIDQEAAEEAARLQAEQEARLKQEEEERLRVDQEAAEQEVARLQAEEGARLKQEEEEERLRAEQEAAVEAARLQAEQEARLKQEEEEERLRAEKEAVEIAARLQAEEEDIWKREEEEERLRVDQEEVLLQAEEEARWKQEEEEEILRVEQEAARVHAEEEDRLKHKEDDEILRVDQEAARLQAEEEDRWKQEEEEQRLRVDQEAARLEAEEEDRWKQEEAEDRFRVEQKAARLQAEEEDRWKHEEEEEILRVDQEAARVHAEEEDRLKHKEEDEILRVDQEAARLEAEEEARLKQEEEERLRAEQEAARLEAEEEARLRQEEVEEIFRVEQETEAARLQAEKDAKLEQESEEEERLREEYDVAGQKTEENVGFEENQLKRNQVNSALMQDKEERFEYEQSGSALAHVDKEAKMLQSGETTDIEALEGQNYSGEASDKLHSGQKLEGVHMFILQTEEQRIALPNGAPSPSSRIGHQDFSSYPVEVQSIAPVESSGHDMTGRETESMANEAAETNGSSSASPQQECGLENEDFDNIYDEDGNEVDGGHEGSIRNDVKEQSKVDIDSEVKTESGGEEKGVLSQELNGESQQNGLNSFGAGLSSYMGSIPSIPASLDFSSYMNQTSITAPAQSPGTSVENQSAKKQNQPITKHKGDAFDSQYSGFEPPTDFDEANNVGTSTMSPAEEFAMNTSMTKSAQNCDSEQEIPSDVESDIEDMYGSESDSTADADDTKDHPIAEEFIQESATAVPQYVIEKFMGQLERIHSEHEAELQDMEKKHKAHVDEMKEKLNVASHTRRGPIGNDIASHDKCLAQQRQLEKEFNAQLQQREDMIADISERNIELKKQVEELTTESEGLNQTIQAR
jgi:hypothetical protein